VPVCTDCHGVHTIKLTSDKASPVNGKNQGDVACAQCHNNVRMTKEFGIPGGRTDSYNASYHGMANEMDPRAPPAAPAATARIRSCPPAILPPP